MLIEQMTKRSSTKQKQNNLSICTSGLAPLKLSKSGLCTVGSLGSASVGYSKAYLHFKQYACLNSILGPGLH